MRLLTPLFVLAILVPGLFAQPSWSAEPTDPLPPCAQQLTLDEMRGAQLAIQAAQQLDRPGDVPAVLRAVSTYFTDMLLPTPGFGSLPLPVAFAARREQSLFVLLSGYTRGIDDVLLPQWLPQLRQRLAAEYRISADDAARQADEVLARLKKASNDPEVFLRLIQAELEASLGFKMPWSRLFLEQQLLVRAAPSVLDMRHPAHPERPYAFFRAQQIMLAQAVYGNSTSNHGDKALEIGFGSPSVLAALRSVIPGVTWTGIDIQPVPAGANDALKALDIKLLQGNMGKDPAALQAVRERGPYGIIYAGDVLFPRIGNAPAFDFGVSPKEHVKMLYDLTAPGGTLVLLNDFARPPSFTEAEAKEVGYNILRWNVSRRMPQLAIDVTFQSEVARGWLPMPSLGDLRLFVLRKGTTDASKIRLQNSREQ